VTGLAFKTTASIFHRTLESVISLRPGFFQPARLLGITTA